MPQKAEHEHASLFVMKMNDAQNDTIKARSNAWESVGWQKMNKLENEF